MAKLNPNRRTRAYGEWRAAQRAEALQPSACAGRLRDWLDGAGSALDPELVGARLNGLRAVATLAERMFPTAREVLGAAVIAAATGLELSVCCRWGRAQRYARVHQLPVPQYSADLVPLLGRPCNACVQRWRRETRARVNAGKTVRHATVQRASATARAGVSAVGTRPLERFHNFSSKWCGLCHEAVERGLVASALPQHPRMYALPPDLRRLLDNATSVRHATSASRRS
ncbi:hypothetical protein [Lentzea flaviverrucosa]|uniref:Uncharacterized protein n=1 Tax=Lentzea flaviverrucosa TaxID=200379 RepID=A0A1H9XA87_9PSEU|nr:hypothetical protein [Lentzea flaviverrucosa]RDI21701.1 hypothetical protein DFR72_113248 [Lentzea flaviverrucosa]SES43042.1 hypothetical protein SAMN05216195_11432 [Lentzea flaviverrucosa]